MEAGKTLMDRGLNRDEIKLIAMVLMLGNHISAIFLDPDGIPGMLLTGLGFFTAPVMCCFLTEGFRKTASVVKYGQRLLAFAAISQIPYMLAFTSPGNLIEYRNINMVGQLFLCFLILWIFRVNWPEPAKYAAVVLLVALSSFFDWAFMAPVFTIFFDRAGKKEAGRREAWIDVLIFYAVLNFLSLWRLYGFTGGILRTIIYCIGPVLAALVVTELYNGKRAESHRKEYQWFFYLFYPVHLLILGILRILVLG